MDKKIEEYNTMNFNVDLLKQAIKNIYAGINAANKNGIYNLEESATLLSDINLVADYIDKSIQ